MSRHIDGNELRNKVLYFADAMNLEGNHEQTKAYNHCLCMIDDMPTADVVPMEFHERCMELEIKKRANMVEVVRCKDCRHKHYVYAMVQDDNSVRLEKIHCDLHKGEYNPNFYCSFGERGEDEH